MRSLPFKASSGFTLVEVAIIVPILVVTALVLFNVLYDMMVSSAVEREQINLIHDKHTAMNIIEDDVLLTSRYLAAVDGTLTDLYPPSANGYKGTSATNRSFLLRAYSTTTNPLLGGVSGRKPVFIGNPAGSECDSTNIYFNAVQQYNIIYFVKNGDLFRRRVVDKTTQYCNPGQYQKLSCPSQADLTAQGLGTRNATCDVDDELLVRNVTSFTINYYDEKTSTTPLDVYAGGADPALVSEALDGEVVLTVGRIVSGKTISSTSSLRMSKLNLEVDP